MISRRMVSLITIVLAIAAATVSPSGVATADTVSVGDGDVEGLIKAITAANDTADPDTIELATGGAYVLTDGSLPRITSEITINGNGATIERDADAAAFRIFRVDAGGNLTLNDLTIRNGLTAFEGGAIYNNGTLTITNSTLSGNSSDIGGGIDNHDGTATLKSTIVANNTPYSCMDTITSAGYNLDSDGSCDFDQMTDLPSTDPHLGPLQDNGGPTETHALTDESPAIDQIPDKNCTDLADNLVDTDQRSIPRPLGGLCDIGAFELDYEPPTWQVPDDITVSATSSSGAEVSYPATVSDNVGVEAQGCVPASGSVFQLGATTVNCVAEDTSGNVSTASFDVKVVDDEDPSWEVPDAITVTATSLSGAEVGYPATASDNVDVATQSCEPASGSVFQLGTTTVNCTATDTSGNDGKASFNVTVEVNRESVVTLIQGIEDMGLPQGVENNLVNPLEDAQQLLEDGNASNDGAACSKLDEFLMRVEQKLNLGQISEEEAGQLTDFAEAIKEAVECP